MQISVKDAVFRGKKDAEAAHAVHAAIARYDELVVLGVRFHDVRKLRRVGAIIRTPSVGEINRVVAIAKFAEVGLAVERNRSPKPRITVFDVRHEYIAGGIYGGVQHGSF